MEKIKNPKVIYLISIIIIIIGIIVTCIWKTNFSLLYKEHIRIDVHIGKEYDITDIKQIANEVFECKEIYYQEIETFHDTVAINVEQVNDEQLTSLTNKLSEKYEIEDIDSNINITTVPHYRIRDIVKPYIVPMIITTLIILAYVGIRYMNLGIFKVILTLLIRLIVSEAVLASIIQILRMPVGMYTLPVAIIVYILVTVITIVGYENKLRTKEKQKDSKESR